MIVNCNLFKLIDTSLQQSKEMNLELSNLQLLSGKEVSFLFTFVP